MKKYFFTLAVAVIALCSAFVSCQKEENGNTSLTPEATAFIGVYDLSLVYDSITTSDGTWYSEEFYEEMTGKTNPPQQGYLTIEDNNDGKLKVTATIVKENIGEEKVFFSTKATEKDGILILENCTSDYYYSTTEEYIRFEFRNFANNLPQIYFKGIYTINLGLDYSYLNSYTCVKRP